MDAHLPPVPRDLSSCPAGLLASLCVPRLYFKSLILKPNCVQFLGTSPSVSCALSFYHMACQQNH